MQRAFFFFLLLGAAGLPGPARADNIFGEFQRVPDTIERGIAVGGDFGFFFFTGGKGTARNPGFQLGFTTGYDLLRFLSLEGVYTISINEADPADPILAGGVNTFLFDLAAKFGYPLGRFYPFFGIGPGVIYTQPEFVPGKNWRFQMLFSGGMEYYTYLRHFSLYLKFTYFYIDLPVDALTIAAGIRYTF